MPAPDPSSLGRITYMLLREIRMVDGSSNSVCDTGNSREMSGKELPDG